MPFEFERQKIEEVILVKPKVFGDSRGFFMESYKKSDFFANGIDVEFNQDNHSKSTKGVLRGLHYQANPYGQAKLVRCSKGRIYDVAVLDGEQNCRSEILISLYVRGDTNLMYYFCHLCFYVS